jgi:RimJ/RimL family protein N-acetyltransferase
MRGFEERDLDAYARFTADEEVMRYMGRGPFKRDEAWRELAFFIGHFDLRGYTHWALELRETGELVGRCGPYFTEGWPALEVGWLLAGMTRVLGRFEVEIFEHPRPAS